MCAPFPPSRLHPFGTDQWGRDLLARSLYSTWNTLGPVLAVTGIVLTVSLALSIVSVSSGQKWLSQIVTVVGGAMASLPVLFILILALDKRNMHSPYQELQYIGWIALFETGRAAFAFQQSMEKWMTFEFVESAVIVGRSRTGVIFSHLRSWVGRFSLEFAFSEFARVLSLMTMLAAFHVYAVETLSDIPFFISFPPIQGIQSSQVSWISLIGDSTNNGACISYPYFLYAPVLAVVTTVMGANFIARGIRGTPSR